jgi:hypothetical protein
MEEMQKKSKRIQNTHKLPSNHAIGVANTKLPPQRSKMSHIKGFGKNISHLPLRVNVFHLYISLFNMVSQEMVSHFFVFHSPMKNWVLS